VEARFNPFGDCANLAARYVHGLRQTYHRLRNRFRRILWTSLVTWIKWNLVLVYVRDSVSVSARYVHGLHQMYHRLRIDLDGRDGTPR
jgi:hypothetical protein